MATYSKKRLLPATVQQIPQIAESIRREFEYEDYEVKVEDLLSGGTDISITKGGTFKAVMGMKTALKVTLIPQPNGVLFDAGVGIFGQQAIPTIISMFFFWPVLITQIWGLVNQSKLDDRALEAAQRALMPGTAQAAPDNGTQQAYAQGPSGTAKFCPSCGTKLDAPGKFCPECGCKL